jgi:WD40 repeat protein
MISQSNYSYPVVVWRPDGTGIWVNSDEGAIKGIDMSGKIVATLTGHEPGSKVRCLYSEFLSSSTDENRSEILVSGGFDQKLIAWTTK